MSIRDSSAQGDGPIAGNARREAPEPEPPPERDTGPARRGPSRRILEDTRSFWRGRTGAQVSEEDAREAVRNVTGFFELLARWDQAQDPELHKSSDDDGAQSTNAGRT